MSPRTERYLVAGAVLALYALAWLYIKHGHSSDPPLPQPLDDCEQKLNYFCEIVLRVS